MEARLKANNNAGVARVLHWTLAGRDHVVRERGIMCKGTGLSAPEARSLKGVGSGSGSGKMEMEDTHGGDAE
jgi:hypothetical protein